MSIRCRDSTPLVLGSSTFRGNALGSNVRCPPQPVCGPAPCPGPATPECLIKDGFAYPRIYESTTIPDFVAFPNDGLPAEPEATIRLTRTAAGNGAVFSIGTALYPTTGRIEGFILRSQLQPLYPGYSVQTSHALVYTDAGGNVHRLNRPKAVAVLAKEVVVVGGGETLPAANPSSPITGPAIAVLQPSGACAYVTVVVGNGASQQIGEIYNDIVPGPCETPWYVVGSAVPDPFAPNVRQALARIIDPVTYLPQETGTGQLYTYIDFTATGGVAPFAGSEAVSVALHGSMIVAAVHTYEALSTTQSMLWPLRLDLTQISPWTATAFNSDVTNRLQLGPSIDEVIALRVFATREGEWLVATLSHTLTAAGLPNHVAQSYRFTADTMPDVAYGQLGISTWFQQGLGATRPNDALLTQTGLVMVGNAFFLEASPSSPPTYAVPHFEYLDVTAGPDVSGQSSLPQPFMIRFRSDGVVSSLLPAVAQCTCAPFVWASSAAQFAGAAVGVMGDVNYHVATPAQAAYVLSIVATLTCPSSIGNGNRTAVPVVQSQCDGRVTLDALCAPTLVVSAGPIVVGVDEVNSASPAPGTIRFDPATRTFQGYDGTTWQVFTTTPVP